MAGELFKDAHHVKFLKEVNQMELKLLTSLQQQFEEDLKQKTSYGAKELPQLLKSSIIKVLGNEIERLKNPIEKAIPKQEPEKR